MGMIDDQIKSSKYGGIRIDDNFLVLLTALAGCFYHKLYLQQYQG